MFRGLMSVEQVDKVVAVVPEWCRHCEQPFPETTTRDRGPAWRHQVVELLPLAVRVTECPMPVRRCACCGRRTRASLLPAVHRRPFEARLSLGVVVRQEQAQSVALAPIVEAARAAIPQAPPVSMDETGWRQEKRRAWLWTVVTAELTAVRIDRSRSGAVVDALLGPAFAGVVGSDRWSAYQRFPAERRALCYAHLNRDLQALVDRGGEAAPSGRWVLAEIERPFALWQRYRAGGVRAGRVAPTADAARGEDGAAATWAGNPAAKPRRCAAS